MCQRSSHSVSRYGALHHQFVVGRARLRASWFRAEPSPITTAPTGSIVEIRMRYKAAFDAYRVHSARAAEYSRNRDPASETALQQQEQALSELAKIGRDLSDVLTAT
jgi:hypothetical protein